MAVRDEKYAVGRHNHVCRRGKNIGAFPGDSGFSQSHQNLAVGTEFKGLYPIFLSSETAPSVTHTLPSLSTKIPCGLSNKPRRSASGLSGLIKLDD
jgi:hypothetical protein